MSRVGLMLEYGRGGAARDRVAAYGWYRKAAEAGSIEGMKFLAEALQTGSGIEKNLAEASHWYRKAADAITQQP